MENFNTKGDGCIPRTDFRTGENYSKLKISGNLRRPQTTWRYQPRTENWVEAFFDPILEFLSRNLRPEKPLELIIYTPVPERILAEFCRIPFIHRLEIMGGLRDLPKELKYSTSLRVLDLSYNRLTTFPNPRLLSPQLQELNLKHNQISSLQNPELCDRLRHLRKLDLKANPISPNTLEKLRINLPDTKVSF